jgi:hypothetical protein
MFPVKEGPTLVEQDGDAEWTFFVESEMQAMAKIRAQLQVKALSQLEEKKDQVIVVRNAGPDVDGVYVQHADESTEACQCRTYQSMHPYRQVWLVRKNNLVFVAAAERLDSVMQISNLDFVDPMLPSEGAQCLDDFPHMKHVLLCGPEADGSTGYIVNSGATTRKVHPTEDSMKITAYNPEVLSFDLALKHFTEVGSPEGYNPARLKWGRYLFDTFGPLMNSKASNADILPAFAEFIRLMNCAEQENTDFNSNGARDTIAAIDGQLNIVAQIPHMVAQDGSDEAYAITLNAAQFMLQVFNECSQAAQPTIARVGASIGESSIYGIFLENRDGFVRGSFKPKNGARWESGDNPCFTAAQMDDVVVVWQDLSRALLGRLWMPMIGWCASVGRIVSILTLVVGISNL